MGPVGTQAQRKRFLCRAIHVTKKRLIEVQRKLKKDGQNWRAFEILNLGKYQRQHYLDYGVSERDEIKLLDNDDNHIECKIIENGEGYIKVDKSLDTNSIFVYGYKIDDLHMLTKEYIFTLNEVIQDLSFNKPNLKRSVLLFAATRMRMFSSYNFTWKHLNSHDFD